MGFSLKALQKTHLYIFIVGYAPDNSSKVKGGEAGRFTWRKREEAVAWPPLLHRGTARGKLQWWRGTDPATENRWSSVSVYMYILLTCTLKAFLRWWISSPFFLFIASLQPSEWRSCMISTCRRMVYGAWRNLSQQLNQNLQSRVPCHLLSKKSMVWLKLWARGFPIPSLPGTGQGTCAEVLVS